MRKIVLFSVLALIISVASPVILSAAAWRHGASMIRNMKQQGIAWPEFKGREMADLIAYLNSTRIVRVASVKKNH